MNGANTNYGNNEIKNLSGSKTPQDIQKLKNDYKKKIKKLEEFYESLMRNKTEEYENILKKVDGIE